MAVDGDQVGLCWMLWRAHGRRKGPWRGHGGHTSEALNFVGSLSAMEATRTVVVEARAIPGTPLVSVLAASVGLGPWTTVTGVTAKKSARQCQWTRSYLQGRREWYR